MLRLNLKAYLFNKKTILGGMEKLCQINRFDLRRVSPIPHSLMGRLKKATSGVLAILPTFGLTDLPLFAAFALTYSMYAPRIKMAAALLD